VAKIRVNPARCIRCGKCVGICPEGLFIQRQAPAVPRIPRQSACIGCGHCVSICPVGAVEHVDFPRSPAGETAAKPSG